MTTLRSVTYAAACTAALIPFQTASLRADSSTPDSAARARIDNSYGKLPLQFEANQGQQPAQVKFLSRGKDYTVFLTPDGATLSLRKFEPEPIRKALDPAAKGPKLEAADLPPEAGRQQFRRQADWRRPPAGCRQLFHSSAKTPPNGGPMRRLMRTSGTSRFTPASTWFSTATSGSLSTISCWGRVPSRTPSGWPWRAPSVPRSIPLPATWCCRPWARRFVSIGRWFISRLMHQSDPLLKG